MRLVLPIVLMATAAPSPPSSPAATAPASIDTPARSGKSAPNDAAVVIGLEDYLLLPDVPYARRDARSFYDFLVYTRGVPMDRVRLLEAAAREQIEAALREAAAEVGPDGTLWLYFAGHGAAGSDGTRILLGDDARQDPAAFEARALRLDTVQELAEGKRAVVVLDTCFSGSGRGGAALAPGKRFAVPTHATAPTGALLVWTATSPSETSGPYEAVRHGAFTYFAVGALRGWADGELDGKPDGQVSAAEAQAYVRRSLRTIQERSQNPTLQGAQDTVLVAAAEPAPRATWSSGAVPRDRDGDGRFEITEFYADGQLIRVEMDTNADGKPDTWEYYENGQFDRRGVDRDMDGEVDQWVKTP